MKPYGREKKVKGGNLWKVDRHLKKYGHMNWWEDIIDLLPRSTIKRNWKKEIEKEIEDELI